jgi:hypothetical protein
VVTAMWLSLSIMLGVLALLLFGLIYAIVGEQPAGQTLSFNWLAVAVLTGLTLAGHQFLHAGVSRLFGGQPRIQLDVLQWILPVVYCRVTGQYFTRSQFLIYALAPLVVISFLGVAVMPLSEHAALLLVPLAANASLSTRDIWTAWIVWRLEPGSTVRVEQDGLSLLRPSNPRKHEGPVNGQG